MTLIEFLRGRTWIGCCAAGVLAAALAGCGGGGSGPVEAAPGSADSPPPSTPVTGSLTVTLTADADEIGFGNTVAVHAKATSPSGATVTYAWKNIATPSTTADASVKTPELATVLAGTAAPASDPGGYYGVYKQADRMGVLPINPDNRGAVTASVTVTDALGATATASVTVNAAGIATGLRNVAVGQPVYLNSGHADPSAWTLTAVPSGSNAALSKATTRNASFTPDLAGKYTVQENGKSMDIYAGTWQGAISGGSENAKGLPSVKPDDLCMTCHSLPAIAPDMFTAWAQTPHATFFATGVNGLTSNGSTCVSCHTVGSDPAPLAKNGGFDDVAKDNGWIYPAIKKIGNWLGMWSDPKAAPVARMANIQCENCHGPNVSGSHKTTSTVGLTGLRTSLDAAVCASCHASGTGHHNYSEWQQIDPDTGYGHSKSASGNSSFTGSGSCARCHTAEGFLIYLDQLSGGNVGSIPTATLTAKVTADTAHSVTCAACHDPHDASISGVTLDNPAKPGAPSSTQLRVFDNTKLLPSGFSVSGFGSGALCVVCHNSRNGAQTSSTTATYLHEDGETYNSGNPTGYSAPHQAAQGDVVAGRNAYFMGTALPMLSKHANVKDSCAGCHMTMNPQTHLSHGATATSKHVFYIRDQDKAKVCANCHGSTDGEALVNSTENGLAALGKKMVDSVKAKLAAASTSAPVYFKNVYLVGSDGAIVLNSAKAEVQANFVYDGTNAVVSVANTEVHGQIGHTYTLTNPFTVNVGGVNYTVKSFEVGIGSIYSNSGMTTNVYGLGGNMVRAGWNYYLIEGDQSKGIHNPSFATGVLNATIAKDLSN